MRVKGVRVSQTILADIFTVGWKGEGVACVQGLPPGARLVRSYHLVEQDCVELVFEHADFEEVEPFALPPLLDVVHTRSGEHEST